MDADSVGYKELQQIKDLDHAGIQATGGLTLNASESIKNQGASLSAGKDLVLTAGKDIDVETVAKEKHVAVTYGKSSAEENDITQLKSSVSGSNINLMPEKTRLTDVKKR